MAVGLMGLPKQGHGARDADGVGLSGGLPPGQRITGGGEQVVGAAAIRGHLTAIEHRKPLMLGIPVQQKTATSQARALGFNHRQHRLRRDQGIDGAAAVLQNSQGFCTGQGIGGDHHG